VSGPPLPARAAIATAFFVTLSTAQTRQSRPYPYQAAPGSTGFHFGNELAARYRSLGVLRAGAA
jgi:hypothetical protein